MLNPKKIKAIKIIVKTYFKNSKGEPYELTDGQCEIFAAVVYSALKWVWISAPTRYGKSEVLALAVIYLAVFHKLKVPIVAGSSEKAEKIMQYVVQHLPDHKKLYRGLVNLNLTDVEKLKVRLSKDALRWADGGWIYITSVDSRNVSKEGEGVVGEGGDVVVLEEAGLIKSREQFSKIVRMPEENKGWAKLVMIGNCIEGSVFEDAYKNPLYKKVRIDLEQAKREGRYSDRLLEAVKAQTTGKDWKRYWLVVFPDANEFAYFKPQKYEMLPREFDPKGELISLKYYGSIDPSLGEIGKAVKSNKGSKIGIIVLARDTEGKLYEVESVIEHIEPDTAVKKIFNFPYKFTKFVFEAIQFQKYFLQVTKDLSRKLGLQIPFVGISQTKNKTERIESLEPFINNGDILFKGDNQLWKDMLDYPNTEFLDGLDALEMAFRAAGRKNPSMAVGDEVW